MAVLTPARREKLHRRGLLLEWFTVAWNFVEAFVAIGVGLVVGSVALVGFGVDSGIEVISAVALLWRLYRAGPNASAEEQGSSERRALYLVAATFFLLAAYITYEAVGALLSGEGPESSTVALVLSIVSLLIMPTLAYLKGRTGREMGSRALVADSKETWVCAYLSFALLRRGPQRSLRVVVGRPRGCSSDVACDPLAGVGDPGGGAGGTRGGGAK
jgi:divalent metal cation (Fe/Co/Zn/Cd) transporter